MPPRTTPIMRRRQRPVVLLGIQCLVPRTNRQHPSFLLLQRIRVHQHHPILLFLHHHHKNQSHQLSWSKPYPARTVTTMTMKPRPRCPHPHRHPCNGFWPVLRIRKPKPCPVACPWCVSCSLWPPWFPFVPCNNTNSCWPWCGCGSPPSLSPSCGLLRSKIINDDDDNVVVPNDCCFLTIPGSRRPPT